MPRRLRVEAAQNNRIYRSVISARPIIIHHTKQQLEQPPSRRVCKHLVAANIKPTPPANVLRHYRARLQEIILQPAMLCRNITGTPSSSPSYLLTLIGKSYHLRSWADKVYHVSLNSYVKPACRGSTPHICMDNGYALSTRRYCSALYL